MNSSTSPCWAYSPENSLNLTGNLSDFPRTVDFVNLTSNKHITGNVKDLPMFAEYIDLHSSNMSGDVNDLPKRAHHIDLHSSDNIMGTVRSFARHVRYVDLSTSPNITGTVDDIPCHVAFLSLKPALEQSGAACLKTCSTYTCPKFYTKKSGTTIGSHWQQCCSLSTIRLAGNGATATRGRLEVLHNSQWGTVCDDGFASVEAQVVCRHLGFAGGQVIGVDDFGEGFGEGSGHIWLDTVDCTGSENRLEECAHDDWGHTDCDHSFDVGIACNEMG